MNATATTPIDRAQRDAAETTLLRRISGQMQVPSLCRRAGCFRARACRGEPRDCLARCARLVPEDARAWIRRSLAAQIEAHDFDEVRADFAAEFAAYADWCEAAARVRRCS